MMSWCCVRTETVTRDKCQFVFEKECLPLGKEKCKNFPELLCDVVNVTKVQQQCEAVTDRQVRCHKLGKHSTISDTR